MGLSQIEMWTYSGVLLLAAAAAAAVICSVLFHFKGKKLRKTLEQEYGAYKRPSC